MQSAYLIRFPFWMVLKNSQQDKVAGTLDNLIK
jgi:hypothetical protein